ncbi:MAG: DNA methyltransferase [Bacteroides sp.]
MHTICRYEKVADATSKLYSILKVLSEEGKKDLEELGLAGFSYPKPKELLRQLIEASTFSDSLILDFFSGSATTAHAVMQLNAEDGGCRKYIMVQLPEETPKESEARRAGFNTIPEIAKERIRRAGAKIKETVGESAKDLDVVFCVFRLDSSNYVEVSLLPRAYRQEELERMLYNIKEDRTDLDLLFGAMLSWGVQLSLPMIQYRTCGRLHRLYGE